jgi:Tfp pilus assembly protein PilV
MWTRLRRRLQRQDGFGLLELLIAMTILNVGLLALVAAFSTGTVALRHAGRTSTASTLAAGQLELYRAIRYDTIALDTASAAAADATYRGDAAYNGGALVVAACPAVPAQCAPTQLVVAPDRHQYRLDTYVAMTTPPLARPVKRVTVVVRDATRVLIRQSSDFDASTG